MNNLIKKRNQPERRLELVIIRYLALKGYYVGKTKVKAGWFHGRPIKDPYLLKGLPDLIAFGGEPKTMSFIEVKSLTGRLRPEQKVFFEHCLTCKITYIVARKLEDVYILCPA